MLHLPVTRLAARALQIMREPDLHQLYPKVAEIK